MKSFKSLIIAITSCFLLVLTSCEVDQEVPIENPSEQQAVPKHIIQKLEKAGFHTNDGLSKVEGGYLVEGDIFFTEEMIDEFSEENAENSKQYRTRNLVSGTRTIRVYVDPALGVFVRNSLDEALRRYNALNLRLTFQRTGSASSNDIRIIPVGPNVLGGSYASAYFPRNGRPHNTIQMNTLFYGGSNRLGNTATVIAHEIGHCIGFRHTDYANRSYSCGAGGNEGQDEVGAILIPGTPSGFAVPNSWMLACVGQNTNRPFIASDKTALRRLYARATPPPPPPAVTPKTFYRFYNSSAVDHYYSTNRRPPSGYRLEGAIGKVFDKQASGTIPLYKAYNRAAKNHFYSTNRREIVNAAGYQYQGIAGYVYSARGSGRIALYRFYNSSAVNHFYTTNRNEGNNAAGYRYEGVACYILR